MEMNIRKQNGLTLIGFVIVLSIVMLFAYAGMRLIPMYLEYYALVNALDKLQNTEPAPIDGAQALPVPTGSRCRYVSPRMIRLTMVLVRSNSAAMFFCSAFPAAARIASTVSGGVSATPRAWRALSKFASLDFRAAGDLMNTPA